VAHPWWALALLGEAKGGAGTAVGGSKEELVLISAPEVEARRDEERGAARPQGAGGCRGNPLVVVAVARSVFFLKSVPHT